MALCAIVSNINLVYHVPKAAGKRARVTRAWPWWALDDAIDNLKFNAWEEFFKNVACILLSDI